MMTMMMMIFRNLHLCILKLHLFYYALLCCCIVDVCPRFSLFNGNNWIEWANLATRLKRPIIEAVCFLCTVHVNKYICLMQLFVVEYACKVANSKKQWQHALLCKFYMHCRLIGQMCRWDEITWISNCSAVKRAKKMWSDHHSL